MVPFLVQMRAKTNAFEIYWPLSELSSQKSCYNETSFSIKSNHNFRKRFDRKNQLNDSLDFICKNRLKYKLNESEMNEMKIPPFRKGDSSNVSTTPITEMGCRQSLPLVVVELKGKHCWKSHCRNGVEDMFGHTVVGWIREPKYMLT